jgi:hypothetical protein
VQLPWPVVGQALVAIVALSGCGASAVVASQQVDSSRAAPAGVCSLVDHAIAVFNRHFATDAGAQRRQRVRVDLSNLASALGVGVYETTQSDPLQHLLISADDAVTPVGHDLSRVADATSIRADAARLLRSLAAIQNACPARHHGSGLTA